MRRTIVEWVVTLAVAAVVVLAVEVEVAQPFRVPTSSMEPTLHCAKPGVGCTGSLNDRVIVAKIVYRFRNPERGEIAVFHAPPEAKERCTEGGTYLKRVIGLPGEQISERDGFFYVDGRKLNEPYVTQFERDSVTKTWPRLGKGEYFMMGDNRLGSCDSRTWGPVSRSAFIGPVVATYWPPTRWTVR
ncbi:MAG TPA: signal peptidase I [Gaiellaceae bacterium]|nr:signal peptidase I [Gaiellaceae bacterium]